MLGLICCPAASRSTTQRGLMSRSAAVSSSPFEYHQKVMATLNSFGTRTELRIGGQPMQIYSLSALEQAGFPGVARLPYSMKILLENLLRREDNAFVKADDIRALAQWKATANVHKEIS